MQTTPLPIALASRDELKRLLVARKITRQRYNWNVTLQSATDILSAGVTGEVVARGREFKDDPYTEDNCRRLASILTGTDRRKFGIMCCGIYGNGKTSLLYSFQTAHNELCNIAGAIPEPFNKASMDIVDAVEFAMTCANVDKFKDYCRRPMLALEDIGRDAEQLKFYGNTITPIIDILEYRYQRQLFTFITTNLTLKELKAKYGARVADRFNEMEIIIFNNPDTYRRL